MLLNLLALNRGSQSITQLAYHDSTEGVLGISPSGVYSIPYLHLPIFDQSQKGLCKYSELLSMHICENIRICVYIHVYLYRYSHVLLKTGIGSVRCAARQFHHWANIIDCTYTNSDGIAYYCNCMCYTFLLLAVQQVCLHLHPHNITMVGQYQATGICQEFVSSWI